MAPKRSTAFGLSFPEEPTGATISLRQDSIADAPSTANAAKRKHPDSAHKCDVSMGHSVEAIPDFDQANKRLKRDAAAIHHRHAGPPVQKLAYHPHPDEIKEDAETVVQGEDPDDYRDGEGKPVRQLSGFVVFDPSPSRGFELIPLDLLHDSASTDRQFEAAGCVSPVYLNEEDEGQEDGLEDDEHLEPQHFRTTAIFRYIIDYEAIDEWLTGFSPLYVETQYAWYMVKSPADSYKHIYRNFYTPHRIAQVVISVAQEGSVMNYSEFEDLYIGRWDSLLGDLIEWTDIIRSVPLIKNILDDADNHDLREIVLSRPFADKILNSVDTTHTPYPIRRIPRLADSSRGHPNHSLLEPTTLTGNLDIAVLRPKNQRPTHVTPLIDTLALGLFREHLQVIGAAPKRLTSHEVKRRQMRVHEHIRELLMRRLEDQPEIEFSNGAQVEGKYWKGVKIRGEEFKLGDCLIVDAEEYRNRPKPDIPQDLGLVPRHALLADYFWFGKIIYIDQKKKEAHVQYYEPSSKTYLKEISNSQELFLCLRLCGTVALSSVLGKAIVHSDYCPESGDPIDPLHYFCRFHYDETDGSFTDLSASAADVLGPPGNCPACLLEVQRRSDMEPVVIKDGLNYLGKAYHHHDYALIAETATQAPALVGMIMRIRLAGKSNDGSTLMVTVRLLGRMSDLLSKEALGATAPDMCVDERELFMTTQEMDVDAKSLLQRCTVIHQSRKDLRAWLARSPYHFFVQYSAQTLKPKRWEELRQLNSKDMKVCKECYLTGEEDARRLETFAKVPRLSLRAFDPFAGVGAFGLAMENTGCVKVTHAVEISPSAAQTLRKNSPSTTVYNQCSNIVLRYAIKAHAKQWEGPPPDDVEGKSPLPLPPTPDQIDCIVAGFPCQPHSSLNMFQKANDRKSHLILNLLSWVDYLRPKYCVFENVRGFLSYNLNASQAGRHRVRGGIKMGGLKFLVHALLTMGYQVRFSLLQAGQYGTPQRRVRFFLLASLKSYPLPSFPEPTHAVLHLDALHIKISTDETIKPTFNTNNGTAPFKAVTIRDAIGDLLPFDWKDPGEEPLNPRKGSVTVAVKYTEPYCGPRSGHYISPPKNSYQAACRKKPATDIQHYTRVFKDSMISRIANVPLHARADYRSLGPSFAQFQFANPASATARNGFKPGMYGRLDAKDWFHTTVTNVDPTAKQSYVLHPECRRIFTIRELARSQGFPDWFMFISHRDRLKTMHRQIGNAVPWQVGEALGRELKMAMFQKWKQDRDAAIDVDAD
ncbi:DNA methyltransferase [Ganoderma sinense ZZ0214-1]|uniref:DNA (cytosine-5-)-methyltransferase n=1 Tax=Ganoderma sinense ZZ0214-1 TaxID=1077348 RepID=A0A2G8S7V5_9APHY|nr:DNA methyltransferase [Ganoderma sinense ZZ0214-1]